MAPLLIFESGMSFGELALLSKSPRDGTVLTLTDCYFAEISVESFEKLLMKDKALRITKNIVFLRQIPYISQSLIQDVHGLFLLCREREIWLRGQTIFTEGAPCDKVIVVFKGEVEIYKQNLNSVYYSHETGVLAMREYNEQATLLKSDYVRRATLGETQEEKLNILDLGWEFGTVPTKAQYQGSAFHHTVQ